MTEISWTEKLGDVSIDLLVALEGLLELLDSDKPQPLNDVIGAADRASATLGAFRAELLVMAGGERE